MQLRLLENEMADIPRIAKHPTEIFGYSYTEHGTDAKKALEAQSCPFLGDICKKPRKSEPHIKVGICSVGYKGNFLDEYRPVIICPHRFLEEEVFNTVERLYLSDWDGNVEWVSEANIGVGGSVDYVAVKLDSKNDSIQDFLCVEFQAAGTTGTPWQAVVEFKANRSFNKNSYPYGINWANEFMKTMMQQVYKKGRIIQFWKRKIVFIVQDVAIDYLKSAVDTSDLRAATDEDEIHFLTFGMIWEKDKGWRLKHNGSYSTDLEGINKILGGAQTENFLTEEAFKNNAYSKGKSDGVF